MNIVASIHGRAGNDPVRSTTNNGKDMTRCSIAVNVAGWNAETEETLWVSVLAFGRVADDLERASKGQMVSAMGKLSRGRFTGKDGTERESWSLLADAVLVTASARPTGNRPRTEGEHAGSGDRARYAAGFRAQAPSGQTASPFDDDLPF